MRKIGFLILALGAFALAACTQAGTVRNEDGELETTDYTTQHAPDRFDAVFAGDGDAKMRFQFRRRDGQWKLFRMVLLDLERHPTGEEVQ